MRRTLAFGSGVVQLTEEPIARQMIGRDSFFRLCLFIDYKTDRWVPGKE